VKYGTNIDSGMDVAIGGSDPMVLQKGCSDPIASSPQKASIFSIDLPYSKFHNQPGFGNERYKKIPFRK